jgi:hypothetical protein
VISVDAFVFLKGMPAVLGIAGFFVYLWAGQYRIGGDLMKGVVEKLRAAPNVDIKDYASLTPARIGQLIERDVAVRGAVNDQDVRLIRLIVILHNAVTVIVLLVCAALVGLGIWLIARPEPLSIVPRPPVAARGGADLVLTDLDAVKVEWDAKGATESTSVFLENVDNNSRTAKKAVLADVRSVTFSADELHDVASNRRFRGKNRVRTVVEWSGQAARSDITDILVGIKYRLMIGGTLITPQGSRSINTLLATIDDSTEQMPREYCFAVDFAGWSRSGSALVAPLKACNSKSEVNLPFLQQVEWNRQPGLVLNEPLADRPIARLCIASPQRPDNNC